MTHISLKKLNPLPCGGTSLPPNLLLIAKLMAFVLILKGISPFGRYLPFFLFLDSLGSREQFDAALDVTLYAGYLLLFFSPFARLGCLAIGSALLIGLLACRPCLSVAHTYVACMFLILALSSRLSGSWLFQMQVVILYAGAGFSKATDPDW